MANSSSTVGFWISCFLSLSYTLSRGDYGLSQCLSGFDLGVIMYALPLKNTAQLPRLVLVDGSTTHICWGLDVVSWTSCHCRPEDVLHSE